MKKKLFLVTLALALLVIAACDSNTDTTTGQTGFVGGFQGLEVSFASNAPPDRVTDGGLEEFDVVVELTNKGEHEVLIDDVFVKLEGFSASAFGITPADLTQKPQDDLFAVRKSSDGNVITTPAIPVVFEGLSFQTDAPASLNFPFRAKVCYKYETIAISDLCVKDNFNLDRTEDVCQVSGTRTVSNSGAPVQVTNVRQSASGRDKTSVTFSIQKKDPDLTGKVSRSDTQCDLAQQNEDRVFVSVTGLTQEATDSVRCIGLLGGDSSSGYVTLSANEPRDVSCTVTLTDRNTRVQPFRITLGYDYSAHVDKNVVVVYSPE